MKTKLKNIEVYADWVGLSEPTLIGLLRADISRGKEIFSFEYDLNWLKVNVSQEIDPELRLFAGPQYAAKDNFGVFLDSSPDRWGRVLMRRREAHLARKEQRSERTLMESDYLLGVYDEHRMGALRFRTHSAGPFLDNNKKLASPPWALLRELEYASLQMERDDAENDPDYLSWLTMLVAPGASLGGARPKASVLDENQHLWIAKFPSNSDGVDIGAWEMVAHQLAKSAKIIVPEVKIKKFNSAYHTFLSKRFDRTSRNERLHFSSAMTLLQRVDGDNGASYLELAEFISQHASNPQQDLEQLWRRIVFYICISNVDDHLRNHGFIYYQKGWALSPAYDINPVATGNGLTLNISESDNAQNLALVREVAEYFRLKPERANTIIREVIDVVKRWREVATSLNISFKEQGLMERAFRVADAY